MTNAKKIIVPNVSFYFIRHGETDWNKNYQTLCSKDDIELNKTGLLQVTHIGKKLSCLGITKIYSSPLMRAKQTAGIINGYLELDLEFHEGLSKILDEKITIALAEILAEPFHKVLIVSHGEVYRLLLRILNAQTINLKAKNCGLYFFSPPKLDFDQWVVYEIEL